MITVEQNQKSITRKFGKFINMWKLNSIILNNQWVKEETTKEIRKYFEMRENKNISYKNTECSESIAQGKLYL